MHLRKTDAEYLTSYNSLALESFVVLAAEDQLHHVLDEQQPAHKYNSSMDAAVSNFRRAQKSGDEYSHL